MFGNNQSNQKVLNQIISTIQRIRPNPSYVPQEWEQIFSNIANYVQKYPTECNNDKLIMALINFIANYNLPITQQLFDQCEKINIGKSHALWWTSVAIELERSKNYISAVDIYENSTRKMIQPIDFLLDNYQQFKERMLKRLYSNYRLNLGVLDDCIYEFIEDGICCKNLRGNYPQAPRHDFLNCIGYDAHKAEEIRNTSPSFSRDRSSIHSKSHHESNFSLPQFEEVDFPISNSREQKQESSFVSSVPMTTFSPFKPEPDVPVYQYQAIPSEQPKSILKKQSPIRNTSTGVKFGNAAKGHTNEKRRAPTPVRKRELAVGATINADTYQFYIEKQIGSNAFEAVYQGEKFVIKRIPQNYMPFSPRFTYLFCLPIDTISDFCVTKLLPLGTFDKLIPYIHEGRKINQQVVLYFLLQLLMMITDLESKWMCHGHICPEKLVNMFTDQVIPKEFDITDPIWENVGIKLCSCDRIHGDESLVDRKAVANIFYFLATKQTLNDNYGAPPKFWDANIWNSAFQCLQTRDPLTPIIELIITNLSQNALSLRSGLSKLYIPILNSNL